MDALTRQLRDGALALDIALTDAQLQQLMDYLQLLLKWNKAYNLTAIREPAEMVSLHLLDSLAVHKALGSAQRIADVGTGPGLPGIVLAIMNPDRDFTLLDSNGKKTRFLFQAKTSLKLPHVTIVNERVEAYQPAQPFDMIVSRAFASLYDMTHWCQHLCAPQGYFLAMKGQYPHQEIADLENRFAVVDAQAVTIPGVEAERHLLQLRPTEGVN
ncbi:16S rRNA (guanine(527)-N(7))-methyltransferase RsmG [Bacterioplanes sanyensis]|uniref:Ribosomal RNA small subunit methyltransferase G n=1 Tax=Bacterioplanes sanyensis TaxID=1249553 RepID=A0A222FGL9_9GAMM|nr:16S rRNA (guanine(527)-N(7))-methyltransferase RsmG [Bacterioplanes sanyensis]ASP37890.1 16S rRNA (guanine(527)-N(7))-methyltransferase RsmG [Bacterioplanes sanyensis]